MNTGSTANSAQRQQRLHSARPPAGSVGATALARASTRSPTARPAVPNPADPYAAAGPTPPGDERGREQGQEDGRRDGRRGRARDQQPGPAGAGHGPKAHGIAAGGRTAGTVTARQRRGSPHTAAVLPTRRYNAAGPPGTVAALR